MSRTRKGSRTARCHDCGSSFDAVRAAIAAIAMIAIACNSGCTADLGGPDVTMHVPSPSGACDGSDGTARGCPDAGVSMDAGALDASAPPPVHACGDSVCAPSETCGSCPSDCGACPPGDPCGDGECADGETCDSCSADCGACPPGDPCGDGSCAGGETCDSCPTDCGGCPPPVETCGDGACGAGETCDSCAADCGACPPAGACGGWPSALPARLALSSGEAFYVSPSGSDSSPGTLDRPWRTLQKAFDALGPGQIAYLRAGTYGSRGVTHTESHAGTSAQPITVQGYPGDARPVIHGAIRIRGSYFRLSGVIAEGPTGDTGGPGPGGESILIWMSGSYVELSDSEVRDDHWHAGVGTDGASHYQIIGNYIHDDGDFDDDGQSNTSHGIYASPSSFGVIANNVIEHDVAKGFMCRHDANHLFIVNNTIVGNGRSGVSIWEMAHDNVVANNIVAYNGTVKGGNGIQADSPTSNIVANNNVVWHNGTSLTSNFGDHLTLSGNVVADPLFVDPLTTWPDHALSSSSTDYHLRPGSPAIGAADPRYALPFDITGRCRDASPDAGAYER